MAGADAARTSLDTRAVAGDAADRPYVTSMLRRLGYTDAQIADYLAGKPLSRGGPAAPPHATRATEAADRRAARDIEVEYTGPGLREYRLVRPKNLEFGQIQGETLEFTEAPSAVEESYVYQETPAWNDGAPSQAPFEGWEQDGWRLYRKADATGEDPLAEHAFARYDSPAPEGMVPAGVPDGHEVVFDPATGEPSLQALAPAGFPGWEQDGWRLYKSTKSKNQDPLKTHRFARSEDKAPRNHAPAPVPDGHEVVWDEEGKPALQAIAPLEESWAEAPAAPAEGFEQDGWQLYSKDEGEGQEAQRIFFFSREAPDEAVPAEVPEGYEVAVNPETGRPFLRRQETEPDASPIESANPTVDSAVAGRKRVRIVRVRAADRDAAQRKMEREGRHVLATMPIDIEKKVS